MKKLLIAFSILLYLSAGLFLLTCYSLLWENKIITIALFVVWLLVVSAIFAVGIANLVVAALGWRNPKKHCYKTVMIFKLALIPYYVLNFFIWFLVCGVTANPWLFLSWVIIVPLGVGSTYLTVLCTSAYSLSYTVGRVKNKEIGLTTSLILLLVLSFLFITDVISSIILCVRFRREDNLWSAASIS